VIHVRRSLLPNGTAKDPKSAAGRREVPLFPETAGVLAAWREKTPYVSDDDYIIVAAGGVPVMERNLRRVLSGAVTASRIDPNGKRLSWHALRHSAGSVWISEYGIAITTVSEMMGHANPSITLKLYGHESRDSAAVVADVLSRAEAAGVR
jgi:integrase